MKLVSLAAFMACAWLVQAEYRPEEHLILADCGIGADGASSSRQMMYYHGNPWDENNNWVGPDMIVDVPWDGSYPWRKSGVGRTFPNGDYFVVYIDNSIPDLDATHVDFAGSAAHAYEGHAFVCYGRHQGPIYTLADGTSCNAAFICYHDPTSDDDDPPAPPPPAPPPPAPPVIERKSELALSLDQIEVRALSGENDDFGPMDPSDAFASIFDALDGNTCKATSYPISEWCSITYHCDIPGSTAEAAARGTALATFFQAAAGPKIAETERTWTDFSNAWGIPSYHRVFTYPRTGEVAITSWFQDEPSNVFLDARIGFEVQCETTDIWCMAGCQLATEVINEGMRLNIVAGEIFGMFTAKLCDAMCTV